MTERTLKFVVHSTVPGKEKVVVRTINTSLHIWGIIPKLETSYHSFHGMDECKIKPSTKNRWPAWNVTISGPSDFVTDHEIILK